MNAVRRLWIVSIASVSIVLILWILGRKLPLPTELVTDHKFRPAVWEQLGKEDRFVHLRQAMLDDLIGNHLPLGITALDVYRLLGYPEWRNEGEGQVWGYRIESDFYPGDAEQDHLELSFDSSGALQSVSVVN